MSDCTVFLMPPSGCSPWMRNGEPTIVPIVCRGFSEEYGSWKIICISRRIGRMPRTERSVMSRPSNRMRPDVGSMSFVTARPVVDLPQPDSPTSPRVSPSCTTNETPSTAFTGLPVRPIRPADLPGKCLVIPSTSSRGLGVGTAELVPASGAIVVMAWPSRSDVGPDLGREDLATLLRLDVAADRVRRRRRQRVPGLGLAGIARPVVLERAARVEHAALRDVDQRGRGARDRGEPAGPHPVHARHRAEQTPGVRHLGAGGKLLPPGPLVRPA